MCGDANAHEIRLTLKNNGVNAQLEGWDCQAYCVLNNRATAYSEEASLEGNVVSVTFPGSFYAMAGDTLVILRMLKEDAKIDLLYFMYTVRPGITSTVYDPSGELPDLSDFQAAISACDAAKKAANEAAGTANASAENAEAQAAAARSAADKAYKSASAADDAAADAILAAGDADDATDAANQAAATANAAAQRVEDAIDGAADAADAANAAAALVDAAIEASEQATQGAEASAAAATQAAQEAEAKAALADAAAQGAEASAGEADAAAGRANAAAESIEGLTISESVVEYGAGVSASVTRDPESGALHVDIQTERGPQGPGYTIKGVAYATVAELEAAITSPEVGDQYNVGAAAPYNVYRWTGTGWEDQGKIQGPPGQNGLPGEPGADGADAAAPRMLSFSLPASGWAGSGPYTCAISESSATAKTAVVECVLTAATRANQLSDIDWTTSAGSIALSTTVKPTGELAGYMILTEVQ